MKQTCNNSANRVWFGRWSRKSWAIFSSLKRIVHIIRIKIDIVRQSLQKEGIFTELPFSLNEFAIENTGSEYDVPVTQLLAELATIQNNATSEAYSHAWLYYRKTASLKTYQAGSFFYGSTVILCLQSIKKILI